MVIASSSSLWATHTFGDLVIITFHMGKHRKLGVGLVIVILVVALVLISRNLNTATSPSTPSIYGTDPLTDQAVATPATFEQKQQCAKDGAAWYAVNVTAKSTPQAIAEM